LPSGNLNCLQKPSSSIACVDSVRFVIDRKLQMAILALNPFFTTARIQDLVRNQHDGPRSYRHVLPPITHFSNKLLLISFVNGLPTG
jgi:hypothetical protein